MGWGLGLGLDSLTLLARALLLLATLLSHSFVIGPAVINTHTHVSGLHFVPRHRGSGEREREREKERERERELY